MCKATCTPIVPAYLAIPERNEKVAVYRRRKDDPWDSIVNGWPISRMSMPDYTTEQKRITSRMRARLDAMPLATIVIREHYEPIGDEL